MLNQNCRFLGTENGFLKHLYTRTEIFPCKENLFDLETILKSANEKEISLREASGYNCIVGSQVF